MTNPTTTEGWLHKLDMAKNEAWLQGYAQAEFRLTAQLKEKDLLIAQLKEGQDRLRDQLADAIWGGSKY